MLKKVLFLTVVVLSIASIASSSTTRLQSLLVGGFIEDDSDMFTNPALLAYYQNLVIGELGVYPSYIEYKNGAHLYDQWLGVTGGMETWSAGLVFNRDIAAVDYIASYDMEYPFYDVQRPINPFELMVAYGGDGMAFGGRVYMTGAGRNTEYSTDGTLQSKVEEGSSIKDFALGIALDLADGNKVDAYGNLGLFSFSAVQEYPADTLATEYDYRSEGGKYIVAGGRGFFSMTKRMRLVPLVEFSTMSFTYKTTQRVQALDTTYISETDNSVMCFKGGVALNTQLSRHSTLVVGVSFDYSSEKSEWNNITDETTTLTLPLFQAGLEANLAKWFIARIGIQKAHSKITETYTSEAGSAKQDESTTTYTYSPLDFLSLGFGIRLNRFLIDATLMEDIPFTGTYLLSGISENLCGKMTVTYSF